MPTSTTRTIADSFGSVQVPAAALWGAQTERSRRFFAIGTQTMPLAVVHALADIKQAAAEVNRDLGLLSADKAGAIASAAARVAAGAFDSQFPLSVWQTGSGTQSHMNVNEVLATLANQALAAAGQAERVHPNDDVNLGQSTNDVFPTAMHLATVKATRLLQAQVALLRAALACKAQAFAAVVKTGRTHLQDATPITLGQEFGAYVAQLAMAEATLERALPDLLALALGGTAVGTGMNTHAEFGARVVQLLAQRHSEAFVVAPNLFAAMAGHEALVNLHAALRTLAVVLNKLANDIRFLSCGPRAGIGELRLPANEPGSSMMPGKVNPTQVEALTMVCAQVMGHDVAIGIAASSGQLELNAYKPLIVLDVLDSLQLLADATASFNTHCVAGLEADAVRASALLNRSLMLVTALAPRIGYDRAAALAKEAHASGETLREAALRLQVVSAEDFDAWVQPARMACLAG